MTKMKIKVLNLYAGIGGNRKLWENVEVTAIEINPDIANIYQDKFPNDKMIITDAHDYLLKHFSEYDFIWSSPPCPSHSKFRKYVSCNVKKSIDSNARHSDPIYPDMKLYEEILLLKHYFKGKYAVENVQAYYDPLVKPQPLSRHWFWCNFILPKKEFKSSFDIYSHTNINYGFDISKYKTRRRKKGESRVDITEKDTMIRNCIDPELGFYVFDMAYHIKQNEIMNYV